MDTQKHEDQVLFSEEQFHRTLTNLGILTRSLLEYGAGKAERDNLNYVVLELKEANALARAIRQFEEISLLCAQRFSDQFHHTPKTRRVCPNKDCHNIYAYFYDDFLWCPRCGTKLITTRKDGVEIEEQE